MLFPRNSAVTQIRSRSRIITAPCQKVEMAGQEMYTVTGKDGWADSLRDWDKHRIEQSMKEAFSNHFAWPRLITALLLPACCAIAAGGAQGPSLPASSVSQVVKNMAWNELQASEHPAHFFRYIQRTISSDGSRTTLEIATRYGRVGRLIEANRQPPDQQQLEKNEQLLTRLATDTQLQKARFKDQQSDMLRRDNVIKDMPAAFTYSYAGKDPQGRIMLKFQPAPNFSPTSRQSLVLEGMAGEMWIDSSSQRMAKVDGKLIRDVTIGWGFLARLNTGGRFLLEQSQDPDGTWQQSLLSVRFDGTEFIVKNIHIHETIVRCCFERVPDNLTIKDAVHLLQTSPALPSGWQSRLDDILKSSSQH